MLRVAIGGGTGFVGSALARALREKGHIPIIIGRSAEVTWDSIRTNGLPPCDAVVNLAGNLLLDPLKRFNDAFIAEMRSSRMGSNQALVKAMADSPQPPKVWVAISGVGYYPGDPTQVYTEEYPRPANNFLGNFTQEWEASAALPSKLQDSTRAVIVRLGVVLGRNGGLFATQKLPFSLGLGGAFGSGKQNLPWVHIDDTVGILLHSITNEHVKGTYNCVSPVPATNGEYTKALASAFRRPAIFHMPEFVVKAMFGVDRAVAVLEGGVVSPQKIMNTGYTFKYPSVVDAIAECVHGRGSGVGGSGSGTTAAGATTTGRKEV